MSVYDERPRHRGTRTREPEYIETEDTYIARGNRTQDLALRPRLDEYDDDYPTEVRRRSYREDYGAPQRARSHAGGRDSYYDDEYSEYSPRARRGRRDRDDDYDDYYDNRPRERRKSKVGEALESLGLGGVAATVMEKARSKSRRRHSEDYDRHDRDRGYSRSRSRDGSRSRETRKKWQQAAKAAVITGVIEAVRSRNEAGGWAGPKGQRVATAALGAAGIDGFLDRDPKDKSKRHIVESVVGGLAATRIANGPREQSSTRGRSQSRGARSRSRSVVDRLRSRSRSVFGRNRSGSVDSRGRSQSRGPGLKEAAGLAGVAAVGKAIYDRVRSKSRGRLNRSRSRSAGSVDSYVPSRRPRYAEQRDRGGFADENDQVSRGRPTEQETDGADRARSSSSSSVSTTDLEEQRKKLRGKELLTAGLATVATIHAAHGVYSSMVASEKRHKMVMEGKLSAEEARKRKSKNMLQDAAAVGIAALGIKSAFGEWKDMNEKRQHKHNLEKRKRRHRKAAERRQREMQDNRIQQYPAYGQPLVPQYGDANPYQSYHGNLPPPPVGGYAR